MVGYVHYLSPNKHMTRILSRGFGINISGGMWHLSSSIVCPQPNLRVFYLYTSLDNILIREKQLKIFTKQIANCNPETICF